MSVSAKTCLSATAARRAGASGDFAVLALPVVDPRRAEDFAKCRRVCQTVGWHRRCKADIAAVGAALGELRSGLRAKAWRVDKEPIILLGISNAVFREQQLFDHVPHGRIGRLSEGDGRGGG